MREARRPPNKSSLFLGVFQPRITGATLTGSLESRGSIFFLFLSRSVFWLLKRCPSTQPWASCSATTLSLIRRGHCGRCATRGSPPCSKASSASEPTWSTVSWGRSMMGPSCSNCLSSPSCPPLCPGMYNDWISSWMYQLDKMIAHGCFLIFYGASCQLSGRKMCPHIKRRQIWHLVNLSLKLLAAAASKAFLAPTCWFCLQV